MPMLAVAHQRDRAVSLHDPGDGVELARLDLSSIPGQPHEARFDPRRRLLYISHTYLDGWYAENTGRDHRVSVIDPDRPELVDVIDLGEEVGPHDLWLDSERNLLWVSVEGSTTGPGGLVLLDPDHRAVVDRIDIPAYGPHWITATPDGARLYTSNKEAPFVAVVDTAARRMVGRVEAPGAEGIGATPDGRHVVVAGPPLLPSAPAAPPGLRVITTLRDAVVRVLPTEHPVLAVHVTSAGLVLAAQTRLELRGGRPVPLHGSLALFSADTFERLGELAAGTMALSITSNPDGTVGYVANTGSDTVSVVDLEERRVRHTLEGLGAPHGLAHIPDRDG